MYTILTRRRYYCNDTYMASLFMKRCILYCTYRQGSDDRLWTGTYYAIPMHTTLLALVLHRFSSITTLSLLYIDYQCMGHFCWRGEMSYHFACHILALIDQLRCLFQSAPMTPVQWADTTSLALGAYTIALLSLYTGCNAPITAIQHFWGSRKHHRYIVAVITQLVMCRVY